MKSFVRSPWLLRSGLVALAHALSVFGLKFVEEVMHLLEVWLQCPLNSVDSVFWLQTKSAPQI